MTDSIKWGEPLQLSGRPAWLADDVPVKYISTIYPASTWMFNGRLGDYRLPADHFAYKAIAAGFEPWGGGDEAPADWDGGEVLERCGDRATYKESDWQNWQDWLDGGSALDIIGYRKRAEAPAAETVAEVIAEAGPTFESPMTGPTYSQRETAELVKENDALRARVHGLLEANNRLVAERRAAKADADRLNGMLGRMVDRFESVEGRAARAETAIAAIIGLDPARPDVRQEFAHLAGGSCA